MAKKAVASLHEGQKVSYAKVIKMVKSPSGSYAFVEKMVPAEGVQDYLKK